MRCPDCNKFTSKDTDNEPEGSLEISEGQVAGDVRIFNTCTDCGTELEETTFNVELDFNDEIEEHRLTYHPKMKIRDLDIDIDVDLSRTDEMQTKDRKGRVIKNPRYQKRLYGIVAAVSVVCNTCDKDSTHRVIGTEDFTDSCSASGMDSLV